MRARIETIDDGQPEEVVIYCHRVTPTVQELVRQIQNQGQPPPSLAFFKEDEQYYLSLREIYFFETDADKVFAHTKDQHYEVRLRLYELEAVLPGFFIRVSRSAIVNILHVLSIKTGLSRVHQIAFRQSHKELFGSRMYGKELFRKMNERYRYENQ